jgi:hypothetical protein
VCGGLGLPLRHSSDEIEKVMYIHLTPGRGSERWRGHSGGALTISIAGDKMVIVGHLRLEN